MNSEYGSKLKNALTYVMEGINYQGASSEPLKYNYVAKHWIEDCLFYLSIGYNESYAGECAITVYLHLQMEIMVLEYLN